MGIVNLLMVLCTGALYGASEQKPQNNKESAVEIYTKWRSMKDRFSPCRASYVTYVIRSGSVNAVSHADVPCSKAWAHLYIINNNIRWIKGLRVYQSNGEFTDRCIDFKEPIPVAKALEVIDIAMVPLTDTP